MTSMRPRRTLAGGLGVVLLVLLGGCVYVPPVWDLGDAIGSVDEIQEGRTTRAEVLEILGDPQAQDDGRLLYRGTHSNGAVCIVDLLRAIYPSRIDKYRKPRGGCGILDESRWKIEVAFDEAGVVSQVVVVDSGNPTRSQALAGKSYPTLRALCLGAHADEYQAQSKFGDLHRDGSMSVLGEPDLEGAYLWYALAEQNGSEYAAIRGRGLRETMNPGQLVRARERLGAWQPNPALCDALPAAETAASS